MKLWINNKEYTVSDKDAKGGGGEADIFLLKNKDVAKIYKTEKHPSIARMPSEQNNAVKRLKLIQTKLPALQKLPLPSGVVKPKDLVYPDNSHKNIIGYTMDFIDNTDVLVRYFLDYQFRVSVDNNNMVNILKNIHPIVKEVHEKTNLVFGDFNDANILVETNGDVHIIDVDSAQFGNFLCNMFTQTFVDPMLCKENAAGNGLMLHTPFNQYSDWYAYAVMILRDLLLIHSPFAGTHKPSTGKPVPASLRPLSRITIFDKEVTYPGNSVPYNVLPDELLQYFEDTFAKDKRTEFPIALLEKMRWTNCSNCGQSHARSVCPNCAVAIPAVKEIIRGNVISTNVFRTAGRIVAVDYQKKNIQWIYHENGQFCRNGNRSVIAGNLDPQLRFKICGDKNILAKKNKMFVLEENKAPGQITIDDFNSFPSMDTNEYHYFWIDDGKMWRDDTFGGHKYIGDVLEGRTRFWVDEELGFGFYQAGNIFQCFIIDVINGGINDNVQVNPISGNLLDSRAIFGKNLIWFMTSVREGQQDMNHCTVIDNKGKIIATAEAVDGSQHWLGKIHGGFGFNNGLFCATDNGIVKVAINNNSIEIIKEFPDTAGLVHAGNYLFPANGGLYVVKRQEISLLQIK